MQPVQLYGYIPSRVICPFFLNQLWRGSCPPRICRICRPSIRASFSIGRTGDVALDANSALLCFMFFEVSLRTLLDQRRRSTRIHTHILQLRCDQPVGGHLLQYRPVCADYNFSAAAILSAVLHYQYLLLTLVFGDFDHSWCWLIAVFWA